MGTDVVARIPALLVDPWPSRTLGWRRLSRSIEGKGHSTGDTHHHGGHSYTAMIAERSYQQARSSEEALTELRRCAAGQFDPAVVEALAELLQEQLDQQQAGYAASLSTGERQNTGQRRDNGTRPSSREKGAEMNVHDAQKKGYPSCFFR